MRINNRVPYMAVILFAMLLNTVRAQYFYTFVATTESFDATLFNNSHKIAVRKEINGEDTVSVVFHSADSVKFIYSTNRGTTWQGLTTLGPGIFPAIDVDCFGFRHIVWQQLDTISGTYNIYYDCLEDYAPPVNISCSAENSITPDVVVDSSLTAHIVWTEQEGNYNKILYRNCKAGSLGTIFQVSPDWTNTTHTLPSIGIFAPDNQVYVVWDGIDYGSYSPYLILYRYMADTVWSSVDWIWGHYKPTQHSSIDYDHGEDSLSGCYDYEDEYNNNYEVHFFMGNGGGYSTPGDSKFPVVSTVTTAWSYLFWQEDSAGVVDIYYNTYYFNSGWSSGTIRTLFNINEPVRAPSCCGASMIWTQGSSPPYSIYFADFSYPVNTEEVRKRNTQQGVLEITPNPFTNKTVISYRGEVSSIKIFNTAARLVKEFNSSSLPLLKKIVWDGTTDSGKEVPPGTYFCVLKNSRKRIVKKVVRLR
ncbi:MAG TPA: T9SS type A sorting domain-containing protein [candidate division WOR-3 bacterium]|uniref:T9SS type A sorting domain-containing protein n=1 Tax=candidate division WOR-3 bacterium TaxID=2052148 RepID=A0A9C9EMU4_UNCW3|nr:T9SS type A sorting domain-containing protein [candidate division WOR-3 bacterium]